MPTILLRIHNFCFKINTLLKAQDFVKLVKNICRRGIGATDSTNTIGKFNTDEFKSSWKKKLGLFLIGAEDFIIDDTYEKVLCNSCLLLINIG